MTCRQLVSLSAFADLCGVNKSQPTRWIERRLIHGNAIVGTGRERRIDVEIAQQQLASRRDLGQTLGNGAKTNVSEAKPAKRAVATKRAIEPEDATPDADPFEADDLDAQSIDYQVQKARLAKAQADAQEMKNAIANGELLKTEEAVQAWSEIVSGARSALLAVPKRLRDLLPGLSASDLAKIDAEIRRALKSLSDGKYVTG